MFSFAQRLAEVAEESLYKFDKNSDEKKWWHDLSDATIINFMPKQHTSIRMGLGNQMSNCFLKIGWRDQREFFKKLCKMCVVGKIIISGDVRQAVIFPGSEMFSQLPKLQQLRELFRRRSNVLDKLSLHLFL
jgi:hypothetical protein